VYAVGIYMLFAKVGLTGSKTGIALAHAVLVFPLAVVVIFGAVQGLDPSLARAAGSLGATPWQAFRRVTFPLIRPSVVTAAMLAFLTSFDEVVVALFLSGAQASTLPRKLYESIKSDTDPTMVAASVVLIGITVVVFAMSTHLSRPRAGLGPGAMSESEGGSPHAG
jgi:ABC-type spermidine/putrescine transport system permease subunit II